MIFCTFRLPSIQKKRIAALRSCFASGGFSNSEGSSGLEHGLLL
jgi:hypothetical protein